MNEKAKFIEITEVLGNKRYKQRGKEIWKIMILKIYVLN